MTSAELRLKEAGLVRAIKATLSNHQKTHRACQGSLGNSKSRCWNNFPNVSLCQSLACGALDRGGHQSWKKLSLVLNGDIFPHLAPYPTLSKILSRGWPKLGRTLS